MIMFKIYRYEDDELNSDDLSDFEFGNENDEMESQEEPEGIDTEEPSVDGLPEEDQEAEEDPDFAGTIRTVVGAALVYKRREKSNTYEELWIYNANNDLKKMTDIRNSILAGTDIDPHMEQSEDGQQKCDTTTIGNVQYLHIRGLPN